MMIFAVSLFILLLADSPSEQIADYLDGFAVLLIFGISDWLLSVRKWYGGLPGMLLGLSIIVHGMSYHGQIFDERPVGGIILAYYLLHAVILYKMHRRKS